MGKVNGKYLLTQRDGIMFRLRPTSPDNEGYHRKRSLMALRCRPRK